MKASAVVHVHQRCYHTASILLVRCLCSCCVYIRAFYGAYLFLGCVVESIGIMVITLPVLYPILLACDFDLLWFGVMMVILIEIGQLTPPLGINLFVIQGIWDGRIEEVIRVSSPSS